MSERWRLFIGLPAPPDVRDEIERQTAALRDVDPRARWVTAQNLHVTLLFLGDRASADVPAIVAALEGIARHHDPYDLQLKGAGAFGGGRGGRTVWLRVEGGRAETVALTLELATALGAAGDADGRIARREATDPKPHLTLARAAGPTVVGRARVELHDLSARWRVERLHLYRSRLGNGPPVYEELAAVRLGVRARV